MESIIIVLAFITTTLQLIEVIAKLYLEFRKPKDTDLNSQSEVYQACPTSNTDQEIQKVLIEEKETISS
ncbi:MAG: hypothetical protein NW224_00960 [Leptolyngbyaceae cyanobacterium bins.302]|nr:hypothetical protein [Leptolyngbyaceae cyanobacterium bins.302]